MPIRFSPPPLLPVPPLIIASTAFQLYVYASDPLKDFSFGSTVKEFVEGWLGKGFVGWTVVFMVGAHVLEALWMVQRCVSKKVPFFDTLKFTSLTLLIGFSVHQQFSKLAQQEGRRLAKGKSKR